MSCGAFWRARVTVLIPVSDPQANQLPEPNFMAKVSEIQIVIEIVAAQVPAKKFGSKSVRHADHVAVAEPEIIVGRNFFWGGWSAGISSSSASEPHGPAGKHRCRRHSRIAHGRWGAAAIHDPFMRLAGG